MERLVDTERLTLDTPEHVRAVVERCLTFGLLLNGVVRRATDGSIGALLRDEIVGPLGVEGAWIGQPAEVEDRVAHLEPTISPPPGDDSEVLVLMARVMSSEGPNGRSLFGGPSGR